jgi:hypothetical protein
VQRVAKYAQEKDHHPEWEITNGGKTVNVTLTSHFAGNKVTLYDFQLAERMNQDFKVAAKQFKMFPVFSRSTWASILISFGAYLLIAQGIAFFIAFYNYRYPNSYQRFGKVYMPKPYVVDPWTMPEDIKKVSNP